MYTIEYSKLNALDEEDIVKYLLYMNGSDMLKLTLLSAKSDICILYD